VSFFSNLGMISLVFAEQGSNHTNIKVQNEEAKIGAVRRWFDSSKCGSALRAQKSAMGWDLIMSRCAFSMRLMAVSMSNRVPSFGQRRWSFTRFKQMGNSGSLDLKMMTLSDRHDLEGSITTLTDPVEIPRQNQGNEL
jgi:hypothetical protein